jgi:hypothetical protein
VAGFALSTEDWDAANRARRLRGRKKAITMLSLRLHRVRVFEIARLFGATPGAVSARLFRLRRGRYDVINVRPS